MTTLQALTLGVIEGITEFLPVSSTGHLILASKILHIPDTAFTKSFEISIQLGAILAVVVLYWRRLLNNFALSKKVLIAFIPTAIIGVVAYKAVKTYLLGNATLTAIMLILGGIILIAFEGLIKNRAVPSPEAVPTTRQALITGTLQAAAFVPGVSRSAAAIIGGMATGLSRQAAVEFSFLLAIPTTAAATGLDLLKSAHTFTGQEFTPLALGGLTAFLVALVVLRLFLRYVARHTFVAFGIYRILIGLAFLTFTA